MSDLVTRCRIACCLVALAFTPWLVAAQTVDPLVAEGVQLRIDRMELAHLLQTGQIDNPTWQTRNFAIEQRNRAYTPRVVRLNRDGQIALAQQVTNRLAVVLPPLQAKWNAEAARLGAEAKALADRRGIELAADVPVAAALQADRIMLQRQLEKGVAPQDAEAKSADAAAKIAAMQDKYTGYGGNWIAWFNRQMQEQAAQVVQERDVAVRAADTTSEIGKDAKRATELKLAMERNHQRARTRAITEEEERQANAPLQVELQTIEAKYPLGGANVAPGVDFNGRVTNAVRLALTAYRHQWELEGQAEAAKNRVAAQRGTPLPPLNPAAVARAMKEQQEWKEQVAALKARADRPKLLALAGVALAALALYAFSAWLPRITKGGAPTPSADSYKMGRYVVEIGEVTGQVLGSEKRAETHVWSSGGGGGTYQGTGHYTAPTIHSNVVTKHEFWLKLPDGSEKSVQLSGYDIPLLAGQRVTLISARLKERASGPYVVVVNHSERAHRFLKQGATLYIEFGMRRMLSGAIGFVGMVVVVILLDINHPAAVVLGLGFLAAMIFRNRQRATVIQGLDAELERHAQLSYSTVPSPIEASGALIPDRAPVTH